MDKLPSWSVCFAPVVQSPPSPTTCLPNKTPTPATTMVKSSSLSLFRTTKWAYYAVAFIICHGTILLHQQHHSLPIVPPLRVPRVGLPVPVLAQGPTSPTAPSSIWMSRGGTPNSSALLDSRSCLSQKHSSSLSIIHCGIGSYCSSGSQKTLYPPGRSSLKTLLGVPSSVADLNLFEEEIVGRGKWGGM